VQPFPNGIVPAAGVDGELEIGPSLDALAAAVRFVRDGPVPHASCPHCGGRLELTTVGTRWQVRCPADVGDRLALQLGSLEREELHVLVLNTRNIVIDQERVYQGNVSASLVRVGELFRRAVERHASALILCHNHPSGEVQPSLNDLHLTSEAIRAGQLLDIAVLDHLIVGAGTWVSLRDYGVTFDTPGHDHTARDRSRPAPRHQAASQSGAQGHLRLRLLIDDQQRVVDRDSGEVYDLTEAIERVPWVNEKMYPPPHQYVVLGRCPIDAWDILATAIAKRTDSYLAYFRGYRRPNRYLDFKGRRYWRTSAANKGGLTHMLNRAWFADAESPRRVDQGAKPIDWEGPPWDVFGSPWPAWYVPGPDGVYRYDRSLDPYRRRTRAPTKP
jgi:hypothetical protein